MVARITDLLAAGRTFSFEFSPPKTVQSQISLGHTIAELAPLAPSFVSVTYGAGGTTREFTRDVVLWVRKETSIPPMAHLTCVGHSKAEIEEIISTYVNAGVENVLALAGDPPKDAADARPSDYTYATDLIEHVRSIAPMSIGVAAHPEGLVEAIWDGPGIWDMENQNDGMQTRLINERWITDEKREYYLKNSGE